jgi:hypothetical protein
LLFSSVNYSIQLGNPHPITYAWGLVGWLKFLLRSLVFIFFVSSFKFWFIFKLILIFFLFCLLLCYHVRMILIAIFGDLTRICWYFFFRFFLFIEFFFISSFYVWILGVNRNFFFNFFLWCWVVNFVFPYLKYNNNAWILLFCVPRNLTWPETKHDHLSDSNINNERERLIY